MLRNLGGVFIEIKRKLEVKELKDYTDQELTSELARRINNLSLDTNSLIYPLLLVGSQYLD
jgi:hypothetical protein